MSHPRRSLDIHFREYLNQFVTLKIRVYRVFLKGTIASFDQNSNLLLKDVTEYKINDEKELVEQNKFSELILRGDSIVNISIK